MSIKPSRRQKNSKEKRPSEYRYKIHRKTAREEYTPRRTCRVGVAQGFPKKGFSLEQIVSIWTRKGTESDVNRINNILVYR